MAGILILFMYLLGILWIVIGALMIFAPDVIRKKVFAKMLNAPLKKMGVVPIIAGILLLMAASYNRHTWFLLILGILAVVKGIACIAATEKMEKMKSWWLNANNSAYRIYGVIAIIMGSVVLTGI